MQARDALGQEPGGHVGRDLDPDGPHCVRVVGDGVQPLGERDGKGRPGQLREPLDHGSKLFDPSNLEFTSIDVGNPTVNLIPGEARARFNIRFNDLHNQESLKALLEKRAIAASGKLTAFTMLPFSR